MSTPTRTFRPLDQKTADEMKALIDEAVGRSDRVVMLMTSQPPAMGTFGTNLESLEQVQEFVKAFFNKSALHMMLERSKPTGTEGEH